MQVIPQISMKAARVNADLSQDEAAKRLGISRATLQNYESGSTIPDILTARKIEEVYRFPVDYIFFGANNALSVTAGNSSALPTGTPAERR